MSTAADSTLGSGSSPINSSLPAQNEYKLYWQRYWVLGVFSFAAFNQGMLWLSFSPVSQSTQTYFGINEAAVDLLLNWGPIAFLPATPFLTWLSSLRNGLRRVLLVNITLCATAACIRLFPIIFKASLFDGSIYFLNVAQILNGIAGPAFMSCPSLISAAWFGPHERSRSTSFLVLASPTGCAFQFLIGPLLVSSPHYMPRMLYFHAGLVCVAALLAYAYFPAAPPTPPSPAAQYTQLEDGGHAMSMKEACSRMLKQRSFLLLALAAGALTGVWGVWTGILSTILAPRYSESEAGWMGFVAQMTVNVGGIAFGFIGDHHKFRRRFKPLLVFSCTLCTLMLMLFCFSFPSLFSSDFLIPSTLGSLIFLIAMAGFFVGGTGPLSYELAAEIMYPVPEVYSAGLITVINNAACMIFLFSAPHAPGETMNMIMIGTGILCIVSLAVLKEHYRRGLNEDLHLQTANGTGSYHAEPVLTDASCSATPLDLHSPLLIQG